MPYSHNMDAVIEQLKDVKRREKGCCLLIGAGCSASAGVPLAQEFVDLIKKEYPTSYERATNKNYPECMNELSSDQRRDLTAKFINQAKINWTHIGIALLMKHGYVTRILTTNFDPLVIRACALLGEFPAVYDAAASQLFNAAFIPNKAVFYLHGQHTGFVLMHTQEECKRQSEKLEPVFEFTGTACTWIVAGYSGENDPVFERLAKYSNFDNRLYWLGYKEMDPSPQVQKKLLSCNKSAYYLNGYDSDSFFIELTQRLGLFPPELVSKPFSHLDSLMNSVVAYNYDIHEVDDTNSEIPKKNSDDIINNTREMIKKAICEIEEKSPSLPLSNLLMQGKYDEVISYYEKNKEKLTIAEIDQVYWAYIHHGNIYVNQVKINGDEEYQKAYGKYEKAVEIIPNKDNAWYNWGTTLVKQAESKSGEVADMLYKEAYEKYEKAVEIKPDKHEAWNNWGNALMKQAESKDGEVADILYKEAYEKYEKAVEIKPDKHEAWNNWGTTLVKQAESKSGEVADMLYKEAYEKYEKAVEIKPDKHEAWNNWGNALMKQAESKDGEVADILYKEAYEKYEKAVEIKPDKHEVWNNWGNALVKQAESKDGEAADMLYKEAYEKYEKAVEIEPDKHEAWNNWGIALMTQAESKGGEVAYRLYQIACGKLIHANELVRGSGEYNLACVFALMGKDEQCRKYLEACVEHGNLPDAKHLLNDSDLNNVRKYEWFKKYL